MTYFKVARIWGPTLTLLVKFGPPYRDSLIYTHQLKRELTNMTDNSVFPTQMCCVNNINNQVIIRLITQRQRLQAVLLSKYITQPRRAKMVVTENGLVLCWLLCSSLTLMYK